MVILTYTIDHPIVSMGITLYKDKKFNIPVYSEQIQLRKKDKDNNSNYAIIKNQNDNDSYKKCIFEKIQNVFV